MQRTSVKTRGFVWWIGVLFFVSLIGMVWLGMASTAQAADPGEQIFSASGDLAPTEHNAPELPVSTARDVNVKLSVADAAGDTSIQLTFRDGAGATTFQDSILSGETQWLTVTVKPGYNQFDLRNLGDPTDPDLAYELWVYEVDQAPFSWSGKSRGDGTWRSHVELNFPTAGLYKFDFGVTSGRYQFLVDEDYVQKTAEDTGTVSYYMSAGVHDLYVLPEATAGSETDWSLDVSAAGAANDSLPYVKSGGNLGGTDNDFDREWLPLDLSLATKANFELALGGQSDEVMNVYLYDGTDIEPSATITDVYGGETLWWTADLSAGLSRIEVTAEPTNTVSLAYTLTVETVPDMPAGWEGASSGESDNYSRLRFEVDTAGLYDFSYDVNSAVQSVTNYVAASRYEFVVDPVVATHTAAIAKVVESAGTARYYLGAGTHELIIGQDRDAPRTEWSIDIASADETYDTLPYHQTGGGLGGEGHFVEEWMPINVEKGGVANFELTIDGGSYDGLIVSLFQGATEVYSTPVVYSGETFWWPATLADGVNEIRVWMGKDKKPSMTALAYDLTVHQLPSPPQTWNGKAKGCAGNSLVQLKVGTAGTYTVTLDTPIGFAHVLVDGDKQAGDQSVQSLGRITRFPVFLNTGTHQFQIVPNETYATTEWSLDVEATVAGDVVAQMAGTLSAGETVDPQIPLFGTEDKAVNFGFGAAGGGPLALTIVDGEGGTAFTGSAEQAEVLWGTATLKPGQNTFVLTNTGGVSLTYGVVVYEVEEVPYHWAGRSKAASSWDPAITLNFPSSGVYTFDFGVTSGRYQFLVDDDYIQKTVEADGSVDYYVPAGDHKLTIIPDRSKAETSWALDISAKGEANDSLPYTRSGRDLWPTSEAFNQEWLPLDLAEATKANFQLTLGGSDADELDVSIYGGLGGDRISAGLAATEIYTATGVRGGETLWWTADLPAGLSRIELTTQPTNTASLAYTLTVEAVPDMPAGWEGASSGESDNYSRLRFEVDTAGLYDFSYDVNGAVQSVTNYVAASRYEFVVDPVVATKAAAIAKVVESAGTVRYYLSAGTHELIIGQAQDAPRTEWSIDIASASETYDTLPYHQTGGSLGGKAGFVGEWMPVNVEKGGPVNFELTLDGDPRDGLIVSLFQGATEVYSTPIVYGGETFWWPATLADGVNEIRLWAFRTRGSLDYDLTIHAVPMLTYGGPYTWSGVSLNAVDKGMMQISHSEVQIRTPVSATYHVALDMPEGFATVRIDQSETFVQASQQSHVEFDVPLDEGDHFFRVDQSTEYITTTWTVTASLKVAPDPEVLSVDPASVVNDVEHLLTIVGTNFQPGAEVTIGSTALKTVTWTNSTELEAMLPAAIAAGTYSVTVTNPDDKSDTLSDALVVDIPRYWIYFPIVFKTGAPTQ